MEFQKKCQEESNLGSEDPRVDEKTRNPLSLYQGPLRRLGYGPNGCPRGDNNSFNDSIMSAQHDEWVWREALLKEKGYEEEIIQIIKERYLGDIRTRELESRDSVVSQKLQELQRVSDENIEWCEDLRKRWISVTQRNNVLLSEKEALKKKMARLSDHLNKHFEICQGYNEMISRLEAQVAALDEDKSLLEEQVAALNENKRVS